MNTTRRDFIKGCTSACVLLVPGLADAAALGGTSSPSTANTEKHIEKSIKAGFGGGFALRGHRQSGDLTYAEIEHHGNRYTVASADLVDWKILSAV